MIPPTSQPTHPRVLLVSHNFPPTVGPESYLVHLNALSLHRAGMDVTVLTTSHKFKHTRLKLDEALLSELPPDMQILRTTSYDAWLKSKFPRVGGLALLAMERSFLPESYMMWLGSAVKAGRQQLAKSPAIIYSRAQKHVSNVCGWRLKRKTGLPWVAHFSDIWVNHYYKSPLTRGFASALEKRIIRDADKVVFVTDRAVDLILPRYPESWRNKVSVIPHGYAKDMPSPSNGGSGPLKLIHAGVFYPGMRTPETLFQAMQQIDQKQSLKGRLKLTLLGGYSDHYRGLAESLGLTDIVEFKDAVPHAECQRMIAESDLPVMIDTLGHDGVFLPSKLIEYFAFQKPVLALTELNSAVSLTLKDCGLPMADLTNPAQIANVLDGWLQKWEQGQWTLPSETLQKLASYQIDRVNQPLFEMLHGLWMEKGGRLQHAR